MDTLPPKPEMSDERTFDDTVDRNPLFFRLHSHTSSRAFFDPKQKVLVASLHCQGLKGSSRENISRRLAALEKAPPSLSLEKDSEAVEKHITSWKNKTRNKNKKFSKFISLTSNVLYVFWEWKRRMSLAYQDDFIIIVLKSSELRDSGRVKLGTELLLREKHEHKDAFRFSEHDEEVIAAKYIQSEAILGFMPMSGLDDSIPSWCQKLLEHGKKIPGSVKRLNFRDSLPPEVDKVNCVMARESLRFPLALLAPMLVPGGQQRADIGSTVCCTAIGHSIAECVSHEVGPRSGHETVSEQGVEDGYVPIQCTPRKPITYHVAHQVGFLHRARIEAIARRLEACW
jgi:hypothetical protein